MCYNIAMKTLRLFAILDLLRSATTPVAAEKLAAELEVSLRTIYRDMASLQAIGAPVRGEAGIGYQLEKGYFLPPLHFNEEEMEAMMLGMRLVMARGDNALAAAAQRASGKISATMAKGSGEKYQALPLYAVSKGSEDNDKALIYLPLLRQAIRERRMLTLGYTDLSDNSSQRQIRPLGLTLFDEAWLLTAWCETRDDFRNFRVDRITRADTTGSTFRHEKGRRFQDYLQMIRVEPDREGASPP